MKKIIIALILVITVLAIAVSVLYRKAPALLTNALEKALRKTVLIEDIEYFFPGSFELTGFKIVDAEPFKGETLFYAKKIKFEVSPMNLFKKMLTIKKVQVDNSDIYVRKHQQKFFTAFSEAIQAPSANSGAVLSEPDQQQDFPILIDRLILTNGHFQFLDYDADANGFVVFLDEINAKVNKIQIPSPERAQTTYEINARLIQGRDQKPAPVITKGWTNLSTKDTQMSASIKDLYLPYFAAYYSKVTLARIDDGFMNAECLFSIKQNNLNLNMDIEIINLLFGSYESGTELFGLNADEIIAFLKDKAGRLKFQIEAGWNIKDSSIRTRDIIRQSIEKSLKRTIVSNIPAILGSVIEKIGEKSADQSKDKVESTVQKIKDFLKY